MIGKKRGDDEGSGKRSARGIKKMLIVSEY